MGIEINGEKWLFNNRSLLTDKAVALISSGYIYEVDKVKSIKLIAKDAIGNKYLYNTKFVRLNERNFMVRDDNHNILDNPEYKEIKYKSIELKEIGLPILLNDDKGIPNDNN